MKKINLIIIGQFQDTKTKMMNKIHRSKSASDQNLARKVDHKVDCPT